MAALLFAAGATAAMLAVPLPFQYGAVLACLLIIILATSHSPTVYLAIAVALYLFAHTEVNVALPEAGAISRAAALVIVLLAARVAGRSESGRPRELLAITALASCAYATSIVAHGASFTALLDAGTTVVVGGCLYVVMGHIEGRSIKAALEVTLLAVLVSSLIAVLANFSGAFEGQRLEGYFVNANTLGFFAALALLLGVLLDGRRLRFGLLLLAAAVLILTASRASLLALIISTGLTSIRVIVRHEAHSRRLVAVTAAGGVLSYVLLRFLGDGNLLIVRTNDSRRGGADYAWQVRQDSPWTGIGYDTADTEIASTPLRWLAEGGYVGVGLVMLAYVLILVHSWRRSWQAFLVAGFGVTHSLFEGWFFAGGSGLFLAFWLVYGCAALATPGGVHRADPDTTTGTGLRRPRRKGAPPHGAVPATGERQARLG